MLSLYGCSLLDIIDTAAVDIKNDERIFWFLLIQFVYCALACYTKGYSTQDQTVCVRK